MVKLYTDKSFIGSKKLIDAIDEYFYGFIATVGVDASNSSELKTIDKSRLAPNMGYVITPFGATDYDGISTGCKAAILCRWAQHKDVVISLIECGQNAIDFIFENFDNIHVYLPYETDILDSGKQILVNDKKAYDFYDKAKNWR